MSDTPKYITISYTFSSGENEEPLGSSDISGPYTFLCGAGDAIPGLESRIIDMKEKESKKFIIPAQEAYGPHNQDLVKTIPRSVLPESLEPKEGLQLNMNNTPVTIVEVTENDIIIDANHPLSGVDLHFSVTIESISDTPPAPAEGADEACGCGHSCGCS